jgi:molecular chaperone DnaK (HSP70)
LQEKKNNFVNLILENNQVSFNINHEGQNIILKPEQVLASIFTEIKSTLRLNGIEGTEFVISVPSFSSTQERQAIVNSAEIAGVSVSRLYNESSATLMNYGIFRKSDLHVDNARLVAFVDVGYSKTTFFLA